MEGTYRIVFEKLDEERSSQDSDTNEDLEVYQLQTEAEEIAELRRIVSEITNPYPTFFSGT